MDQIFLVIDVENSLISFGLSSHLSRHTCRLPVVHVAFFKLINISVLNVKLPYDLVCPLVGRSVGVSSVGSFGRSVCLYFLKGREVSLPCFYQSTDFNCVASLKVALFLTRK